MSTRHPPLEITAAEITAEDIDHISKTGCIKRPGNSACNLGYFTGDNLRHALCELALQGLTAKTSERVNQPSSAQPTAADDFDPW